MDEKQAFIERWDRILAWLAPEAPEELRKRNVRERAEEKFGTKTSPDTNGEK